VQQKKDLQAAKKPRQEAREKKLEENMKQKMSKQKRRHRKKIRNQKIKPKKHNHHMEKAQIVKVNGMVNRVGNRIDI